jgi:signal transduction histidine kinase
MDPDTRYRIALLESRVAELDAFNYSIAHELRGPLQAISGFARSLELHEADQLSPKGRSRLRRVIDAAKHMDRLIDDLLGLSRADHVELHVSDVATDELVREVLRELRPPYPATRVLASELPLVQADPAFARQVFVNVIGNALKYSALATEPLVEIGIDAQGAFYVRDNGIGFPAEATATLFEPFERATADPAYPGTGVGLAVVRRLLARHGGWIAARSREGGPTEFRFAFDAE